MFGFGTRLGIFIIVEFAAVSASAVIYLFVYLIYIAHGGGRRAWTIERIYLLNLLCSDFIQAFGSLLNLRWVLDGAITQGTFCTAQGVFKQMGNVGVALATLTIAMHTFLVLIFRTHFSPVTGIIVVSSIWSFIALLVGIGVGIGGKSFYGDTGYCFVIFSSSSPAMDD